MKGCRLRRTRTRTDRDDDELVTKGGEPLDWEKEKEKNKVAHVGCCFSVLFQRFWGQNGRGGGGYGHKVGTRVILVVKRNSVVLFLM